jgi:purine-nucleoside phosphorylase
MPHPAAHILLEQLPAVPVVALVCGSGIMQTLRSFPLSVWNVADLPGMPPVAVKGHGQTVELHAIGGVPTLVFTGRYHVYEGHADWATQSHVNIAKSLGIDTMILTNAAGGLNPGLRTGDMVLIHGVIDATQTPMPLSVRAAPCQPIDAGFTQAIGNALIDAGLPWHGGVYAQVAGPSYETRAEVRMLRRIGADVVGMSTARESMHAASLGIRVAALSLVTNVASDIRTPIVDHVHVLELAAERATYVAATIETAVVAVGTT